MGKYAENTKVPVSRSEEEIKKTLVRYGADQYAIFNAPNQCAIAFRIKGKMIKMTVPLPNRNDRKNGLTAGPFIYTSQTSFEQAMRQRYRALALAIKSKLENVESGISTLEQEFLAYLVMPGGQTVGEHALPGIQEAYKTGKMPLLLPGF